MKHRCAAVFLASGLSLSAGAGASHITDKMAVGLYDAIDDDTPVRVLISGTPLEILDRRGRQCRVRLGDGDAGWLECRYVTDEKPARAMLVEAQVRASRLRDEVNELKRRLEATEQRREALERRLEAAERLMVDGRAGVQGAKPETGRDHPISSPGTPAESDATGRTLRQPGGMARFLYGLLAATLGFVAGTLFFFLICRRKYGGLPI